MSYIGAGFIAIQARVQPLSAARSFSVSVALALQTNHALARLHLVMKPDGERFCQGKIWDHHHHQSINRGHTKFTGQCDCLRIAVINVKRSK